MRSLPAPPLVAAVLAQAGPDQLPPPQQGAEEIRDAARDILSRPEFQEPPRTLYERVLDEVGEMIGELFSALAAGGAISVVAWGVLVVALAGAGYLVVRALRVDRRRKVRPADEGVAVERRRPAADWEAEAAACEARGDWRAALRCRYRALVARLAGTGLIEEVPGRTAGEYRTVVGGVAPEVATPFAGATDLFERAWYGRLPTGPEESSAFREL
ncbi:MAG TPA: DUF4129 domain-containing protein, partial [Acidimicrobiales bacterium]|nr:DUF4129 domain-containing protein [Acidimicrobiales bacterium]